MIGLRKLHLLVAEHFAAHLDPVAAIRVLLVEILLASTLLLAPVFAVSLFLTDRAMWAFFFLSWVVVALVFTALTWAFRKLAILSQGFLFFFLLLGVFLLASPSFVSAYFLLILLPFLAVSFTGWKSGLAWTVVYSATIVVGTIFFHTNENSAYIEGLSVFTKTSVLTLLSSCVLVAYAIAAVLLNSVESLLRRLKKAEEGLNARQSELAFHREEEKRFFQIISHDLRAPVTKITQFLGLYIEHRDTFEEDVWPQVLQDTYKSSEGLSVLLENLFHWFKVRQGMSSIYCESFLLGELVEDVKRIYNPMARSKEIDLKAVHLPGLIVYCDGFIVSTILRNLLSNALKFTPRQGRIVVTTGKRESGEAFLSVSDSGRGLEPEAWRRIQGEAIENLATEAQRGTENESSSGFGLKVCLLLAQRLNGKIESTVGLDGTGTTFTLCFPAEQADRGETAEPLSKSNLAKSNFLKTNLPKSKPSTPTSAAYKQ